MPQRWMREPEAALIALLAEWMAEDLLLELDEIEFSDDEPVYLSAPMISGITLRPENGTLWADLHGTYAGLMVNAQVPGVVAGARYATWNRTVRAA